MKYGEYLRSQKLPEWEKFYLNYDKLKEMIKELEAIHLLALPASTAQKTTSLTVPRPTNAAGVPLEGANISQEQFYAVLEQEMRKIEHFTRAKVEEIRKVLSDVEEKINLDSLIGKPVQNEEAMKRQLEKGGDDFLNLEKYVNLNFMGFHKILKKHDRRLPNPCKEFYMARLHDQSWVRGDFSDIMVTMSRVYSKLRGDEAKEAEETEKQNFVRSTRKYWVHMEDISFIKYTVLQHLPVFLQTTMDGETDSQLTNSVYLDNYAMELYHGRLDKTPGAIALRFRWYGTGTPKTVFVERKTHRESWAGEVSVKERFTIKEEQVTSLLQGKFDVKEEMNKLRVKGKSEDEIREWYDLVSEIIQAINSKQLVPTLRTQYMRTAFQIPFDATVRISLDTNLCMISERTKETLSGARWYRDPQLSVPLTEITRFPHAVLEIKLQLQDASKTPGWVTELLDSGKLLEVHKFSKFIHGSAVIMPEDVRAFPYWIDDVTLSDSIVQSGSGNIIFGQTGTDSADHVYNHLLPHDAQGNIKRPLTKDETSSVKSIVTVALPKPRHGAGSVEETSALLGGEDEEDEDGEDVCWSGYTHYYEVYGNDCCGWAESMRTEHIAIQKVEPKLIFANERTFLSWLNNAVVLSSMCIGILAFSRNDSTAQVYAECLLPISFIFIVYAVRTYHIRGQKIRTRDVERWDDPFGPVIITSLLIIVLIVSFAFQVRKYLIEEDIEEE